MLLEQIDPGAGGALVLLHCCIDMNGGFHNRFVFLVDHGRLMMKQRRTQYGELDGGDSGS